MTILTEDFTFSFLAGEATTVTLLTGASGDVKIDKKGVLKKSAQFNVAGYTGGAIVGATGTGVTSPITDTATNVKADGEEVLLDGCQIPITLSGSTAIGAPTTMQDTLILNAVQSDVKGT